MSPQISVIIPAYNRLDDFRRTLASLAAQSFADFEVIVVDDGSTESIASVVKNFTFPALNLIRHSQNRGAAAARNTGIQNSRGHWVAFLDSDDTWEKDKLALQVAHLQNHGEGSRAASTGFHLHRDGRTFAVSLTMPPGRFRNEILFGCTICPGSTLMVERAIFDDVGPFDENLRRLEDWDWLLRFAERYDITFLPTPLAHIYLSNSAPKGIRGTDPVYQAIDAIAAKHLPRLKSRGSLAITQFRSTLYTERAARAYRNGQALSAVGYALTSLVIYPFRNVAFFQSLWRSAASVVGQRRS